MYQKKELQLNKNYFMSFCTVAAQIKLIGFLLPASKWVRKKKIQFLVTSYVFGLKSRDSGTFLEQELCQAGHYTPVASNKM